jgi:hypothetical protein
VPFIRIYAKSLIWVSEKAPSRQFDEERQHNHLEHDLTFCIVLSSVCTLRSQALKSVPYTFYS